MTIEAPPSVLVSLATVLDEKGKTVEALSEALKEAKQAEEAAERALVDEMVTQQVKSFKVDGRGGYRTQSCVYPNVTDREALNTHVSSDPDLAFLYTVSVNGTKLKSFVKELMENGKPVPPGVEPYVVTEIRRYK